MNWKKSFYHETQDYTLTAIGSCGGQYEVKLCDIADDGYDSYVGFAPDGVIISSEFDELDASTRCDEYEEKANRNRSRSSQLYAFIDGAGELLISDTTNLDRYSNDGVVFNLETRMFDTVSWDDGTDTQIHSSHLTPAAAVAAMKELT